MLIIVKISENCQFGSIFANILILVKIFEKFSRISILVKIVEKS